MRRLRRRYDEQLGEVFKSSHPFDTDIEASGAEIAFARAMDLPWHPSGGPQRGVAGWEVRHTKHRDGHLTVYRWNPDATPYVLVTGTLPYYRVVGWMLGRDAKRYPRKGSAHWVPGDDLTPDVAPNPAALASWTISQATAVNAALADLDPFASMLEDLITAGADEEGVGFVISPRDWGSLLRLKESATSNRPLMIGQSVAPSGAVQRTILGRPVALTPAIATNAGIGLNESTAYAIYWPGVVVVERMVATVEVDYSALFSSDQVQVRSKTRLNFHVPDTAALANATGIQPAA
jgi:hypothetical protein